MFLLTKCKLFNVLSQRLIMHSNTFKIGHAKSEHNSRLRKRLHRRKDQILPLKVNDISKTK
jgi:hypothetical protein